MMKIIEFENISSTQTYLCEGIKNKEINPPICILANTQSNGIGSRGNTWSQMEKALTFSFAFDLVDLPNDLPHQSIALHFGFIFKEVLNSLGFDIWLKWPNDLYTEDKKVGGIIANIIKNSVIVGIGLNLKGKNFFSLQSDIDKMVILENFLKKINKVSKWKDIFSKYELEFHKNFDFFFHDGDELISLKNAKLLSDGGIYLNEKKFYNLR